MIDQTRPKSCTFMRLLERAEVRLSKTPESHTDKIKELQKDIELLKELIRQKYAKKD